MIDKNRGKRNEAGISSGGRVLARVEITGVNHPDYWDEKFEGKQQQQYLKRIVEQLPRLRVFLIREKENNEMENYSLLLQESKKKKKKKEREEGDDRVNRYRGDR